MRISALEHGDDIIFSVRDTGIGIDPKDHEKIFQEFAQIENPLQEKFHGTGLGLPLCRNMAALLGGKVWVESELEHGSTFYTSIPRIYRGEDLNVETEEAEVQEFHRAPVLLVNAAGQSSTCWNHIFASQSSNWCKRIIFSVPRNGWIGMCRRGSFLIPCRTRSSHVFLKSI